MAFTENLSVFLNEADFAVSATLGAATFPVIFDRAHLEAMGINGTQPMCMGKTSNLGSAARGASITVNGASFTVLDNQPDGTGMTTLLLQAA
jgi:hypothetical protein